MSSEDQTISVPAEDRAALREELLRSGDVERLQLFDALAREADGADGADAPQMPGELRDRLLEHFGSTEPAPATPAEVPRAAPAAPGFLTGVVAFFRARPLSSWTYGGLAAAACAVMLVIVLPQLSDDGGAAGGGGGSKVDPLRGGEARPSTTASVPVYLFPEAKADEVSALMSAGRTLVLCADLEEFEAKLSGGTVGWAVGVDLDRRVVKVVEAGELVDELEVDGDDAGSVLLGIREALDGMVDAR